MESSDVDGTQAWPEYVNRSASHADKHFSGFFDDSCQHVDVTPEEETAAHFVTTARLSAYYRKWCLARQIGCSGGVNPASTLAKQLAKQEPPFRKGRHEEGYLMYLNDDKEVAESRMSRRPSTPNPTEQERAR